MLQNLSFSFLFFTFFTFPENRGNIIAKENTLVFLTHYLFDNKDFHLNIFLVMWTNRIYRSFMTLKSILLSPSDCIPHL